MRASLLKTPEKTPPEPSRAKASVTVHPLARLQHAAGNQAVQHAMSGAPLPRELRSSLESYFRAPLDRVRVHADSTSQVLADHLGARAFTIGQNIHLGSAGARATGSARKELLAHEVVHTLQQGQVGPRTKLKVAAPGDRYEQQADRLAGDFARGVVPDAVAVDHVGAPVLQRTMYPTHYGNFEEVHYDFVTRGGTNVGVEIYMKFHPGPEVRADKIGLAQVGMGTQGGSTDTAGIRGLHQATSGAGTGRFVDQLPGFANPLYATSQALNPGGDPTRLSDYQTPARITALTSKKQAPQPLQGQQYDGFGRHGFARIVNGAFASEPAELHDVATSPSATPNSGQVFETAALAISGSNHTYYGSVEWGWSSNEAGAVTKVPFHVLSRGVPTVDFLTAATIWNSSRVNSGYVTTAAANLLAPHTPAGGSPTTAPMVPAITIPINTPVSEGRGRADIGGISYTQIWYKGTLGLVESAQVRRAAVGAETVDLPVPMIHSVTNPLGSTMVLSTAVSLLPNPPNTLLLPLGTRVTATRSMVPTAALPNHYEGTVASGPQTGTHGYFFVPDLTLERVGTR